MHFRKFARAVCGLVLTTAVLTGCGSSEEKIKEGMALIQKLDYTSAMDAFEEAKIAGENPRLIARGQGIASMGRNRYEDAITYFQDALSLSNGFLQPIDYDMNYYMATSYTKLEQYAAAEMIYDAILDLDEQEEALFLRGSVRLAQDKYLEAEEDFNRVIEMNPKNYGRLIDIYQVLDYYGYKQAGLDYLNKTLTADNASISMLDRGRIYYYMGEYTAAATSLESARQNSNDTESNLFLGMSYEALGEYNYASNVYESYLAIDDQNAVVYNQLGLCKMQMGKYQDALAAFQAGMKVEGNSVMQSLTFNEVVAYEYMGEFQKASVLLGNYLRTYPDDTAAQREMTFLSTR